MAYITQVTAGGSAEMPVASSLYGICTTAAATQNKVVTCPSFDTLVLGTTIHVRFVDSNTSSNPKLNVNGTGARPIRRSNQSSPGSTANASWRAGGIVSFTYVNEYDHNSQLEPEYVWMMNDWQEAPEAMTASELATGTATTARAVSPKVIADYVASKMSDIAGALVYKGTVSAGSELLNTALKKGWYYIVSAAGTYGTAVCEPGDMVIVKTAGTYTSASALAAAVDVIQTNIDTIANADIDTIVAS